ncbi:3-oxoacyl-ACP synthase (polyketide synthase) [Haloferula helveola]|uniref:3-oxoacyl-ACP synthase (Polyketide synthase) n=2 Tax=Haloferula helveola TaxID=490095 RepID=A0ABN6H114_9BACT|nr:3-oxoacyl-ACP synthase (polyketide synthase) [Haloferula helveola]
MDTVRVLPDERFNQGRYFHPKAGIEGKTYSKWGALVDEFDAFDASFFGISPREADFVDPQQRMLLETAWRAIEDGREVFDFKQGRQIGVFTGVSTFDYHLMQSNLDMGSKTDIYAATGSVHSIAANRISYVFNFKGPSVAVDTACSSALVAIHLACESLARGDCEMALAGGVNSIIGPIPYLAFCKMGMLSPTGRCRAFDSRADGFVRGEGAGMILLKPLSQAIKDGNRIYATIAATASNQDGRTNGITVPSPTSQEALTREALLRAGIEPSKIAYMEAHGTGTPIGDPIEAHALGMALGDGRRSDTPCAIGSVKGNIGHLEAGAGAAGIIKAALSLYHRRIPPSLHFKEANPNIDLEKLKLRVVTEEEELPNGKELPYAGVNSFGFGGANAHAILQAVPARKPKPRVVSKAASDSPGLSGWALPISGGSPEAVRDIAGQFAELLETSAPSKTADICLTAATKRVHFLHRAVALGRTRNDLRESLEQLAKGESSPGVVEGNPLEADHPGPVFVFSGQGPQWYAMGRDLLKREPVFREVIERCDAVMGEWGDWSLLEELGRPESKSRINETAIAQPAIFAIQAGLSALWQSWGVKPAATVGHSVGEVAAAHAAGVLTLEEACRVIFWRGACMEATPDRGRMLAASLTEEEALEVIEPHRGKVHLAAINGPNSVTLSGDAAPLEKIAAELGARQVFNRFLKVGYAFHSHHMAGAKAPLLEKLGTVDRSKATLPVYSTVSGGPATAKTFDANYWWRNVRQAVRFAGAIDGLIGKGYRLFLEVSPHPVLSASVSECFEKASAHGAVVHSLERKTDESVAMLRALGRMHTLGAEIGWQSLYPKAGDDFDLPEMPFRRAHYWAEPVRYRVLRKDEIVHPMLDDRLPAADPTWNTRLDLDVHAYLRDHVIQEHPVFPAAGYLEAAIAAGREVYGDQPVRVENVDLIKAMFLPEGAETTVMQFEHKPATAGFEIRSRTDEQDDDWTLHVKGQLRPDTLPIPEERFDPQAMIERADKIIPHDVIYRTCDFVGLHYGPLFRGVKAIHYVPLDTLAEIEITREVERSGKTFHLAPALLDCCFQCLTSAVPSDFDIIRETGFMPVYCESYRLFRRPEGRKFYCRVRITHHGGKTIRGDLMIQDEAGELVAEVKGLEVQGVVRTKEFRATSPEECLYENGWIDAPLEEPEAEEPVVLPAPEWPSLDRESSRRVRGVETALDRAAATYLADGLVALEKTGRGAGPLDRVKAGLRPVVETWIESAKLPKGKSDRPDGEVFRKLLEKYPEAYPETTFIERVGTELPSLLRGRKKLPEVLSPTGSPGLEEHLLQDAPSSRFEHARLRDALRDMLSKLPEATPLNVLILGAGSGGPVAELLREFDPHCTRVIYADPDVERSTLAEQKFFDHHFVEYVTSGLTAKGAGSLFKAQRFDLAIVLGSEAEAAFTDSGSKRLLRSLRSEGLCLVQATVDPPLWREVAFGLDPVVRSRFLPAIAESPDELSGRAEKLGFECLGLHREPASGTTMLALRGPQKRPLAKKEPFPFERLRHKPATVWVVFTDEGAVLDPICASLGAHLKDKVIRIRRGDRYRRMGDSEYRIRPDEVRDAERLFRELDRRFSLSRIEIVFGWALDVPEGDSLSTEVLVDAQSVTTSPLLSLFHALPPTREVLPRSVMLLSRAGQPVGLGKTRVNPVSGTVIGLGRSMISENPNMRVRLVDLPQVVGERETAELLAEIRAHSSEEEVALRRTGRKALRFRRKDLARKRRSSALAGHRLEILTPGMLDSMTFIETPRRKPRAGEVEIAVKAAALNFRDVLKSLGIYPSDSEIDMLIGDECSGVIERVGPGVTDWKVGDRVISLGAGCFGSHLTAPAPLLLPVPEGMTFEEAATLPVAFMTSVYSLCEIAHLKAGETVLVQAGSGGVGLAAIQLAKALGADVIATAGNPEKRDFLRGLGVEHVFDSRSLTFADEVREVTGGRGVDVVLNSLAGLAIEKGLSCLAPYGRFVEIGKRDIYGNTPVGLRPFRHNLTMSVVDLGDAMSDGGARLRTLLGEVSRLFAEQGLRPLPHRVFPMDRAKDAFRCMAQARHIGKIVLSTEGSEIQPALRPVQGTRPFDPNGSYVVTGGLSGFGREVALGMLAQGVKHLYLVSRSGKADEALQEVIRGAADDGVKVHVEAVDVTSRKDVDALVRKIRRSGHPLKGIVHSAMVLDDQTMGKMTLEQMQRVLAPKVQGTWNLHEATLGEDLDSFVMFSSVSSALGNAGQGNYAAANAFLDSMAHFRHAAGLPALTVNWGQLADVGVAAADESLKEKLTRQGIIPLPPDRALELLAKLIANDHLQTGIIPIDWKLFRSTHPQLERSTRYADVFSEAADDGDEVGARSAREILLETPPAKRRSVLSDMLKEEVAKVLRTSVSKIRDDRPLTQLGLDSLMTFELLMRLESKFEISLPPARMKEGTTLADVGIHLLELISGQSGGEMEAAAGGAGADAAESEGDAGGERVLDLPPACFVDLKKTGDRDPLFMIHPAGGLVGLYDGLAAGLPEDLPVIAIQSRVFFSDGGEFQKFATMADAYADAILKRQPEGDIHLFGFSFGAWLAHAVARRIEKANRKVAWIGLVDPIEAIPGFSEDREHEIIGWQIEDFSVLLGELLGEDEELDETMVEELHELVMEVIGLSSRARTTRIRKWLEKQGSFAKGIGHRVIEFLFDVHLHHAGLGREASLDPIATKVHVWRGNHPWAGAVEGRPLSSSDVIEVTRDVSHFDFFSDHEAARLAGEITEQLKPKGRRRAQARS